MTVSALQERMMTAQALFLQYWPVVRDRCPDLRLAGADLEPIEGRTDLHWALDYDRRYGCDHIARTPNGCETFIAGRVQTEFSRYATITIRDTERPRIADGTYIAPIHVQMYVDAGRLVRVIVAHYSPEFRAHLATVLDTDPRWRSIHDNDRPARRMLVIELSTLHRLNAYVWHYAPGGPMSDNSNVGAAPDTQGAAPDASTHHPAILEQAGKSVEAQRWNDLFNLAKMIANTEIVPKPLKGRPDAIFAIMASAEERGISPLTGLQNIDLIEGRPAPSAMLQRSMIMAAGHMLVWRHVDPFQAVLWGRRRDTGSAFEATFTIDDAKRMKLTGKGNWQTMPAAMLMARVTSLLGRMLFADVLLGMEYTPEELGEVGHYSAIDLDYDPDADRHMIVDTETGEIVDVDDDDVDEDTPDHVVQATVFDAEDALDAEWLNEARGDDGAAST